MKKILLTLIVSLSVLSLVFAQTNADVNINVTSCGKALPADIVITISGVDFSFILVKAGTFMMGSNNKDIDRHARENELPAHLVKISKDYYIGKTEVTQEQWYAIMKTTPSHNTRGYNLPVENILSDVICFGKKSFLARINAANGNKGTFRLPTEAEWEYAAMGGSKSKGYKYSGSDKIDDVVWYYYNSSDNLTRPVGLLTPNELGICDMNGNVSEWVSDFYSDRYVVDPSGVTIDPKGPPNVSPVELSRGGSVSSSETGCNVKCRKADFVEGAKHHYYGFRLVWVP